MNNFEAKDIFIDGKKYAVTKDGGIFMHSYTDRAGKIRKNKWIKPFLHKDPKSKREVWRVHITTVGGLKRLYYVHQIVMMTWGTTAPENMVDPTIDHVDENSLNNHIDNLQWLSRSDNVKKGIANGNAFWVKAPNHQKEGV